MPSWPPVGWAEQLRGEWPIPQIRSYWPPGRAREAGASAFRWTGHNSCATEPCAWARGAHSSASGSISLGEGLSTAQGLHQVLCPCSAWCPQPISGCRLEACSSAPGPGQAKGIEVLFEFWAVGSVSLLAFLPLVCDGGHVLSVSD